ncbi:gamma-glutamyltransferase [Streptomyces sp. NBC_00893]|uniref:gamma-glutamyltransferase n=1 Tax=Streptomyces sp. NBC_00893 TaxID=2975862 RepID=UPI00224F15BF|nr:gamma-glutamyltransferase [Streptomyces sp. NBC_00893]MCX4850647.1 gamma-glutamyltransferase [Streptomyces sp. NBC_00893]
MTVAHGSYAARAGLEAMKQGGNAVDAALTTALTQVALTAGAPISYFGIMSLVYFEAKTGRVHTMNAEWNTVTGETDPLSIPGAIDFSSSESLLGQGRPSGRTALVGGFMKGVDAAHSRFGNLPFASLFQPAVEVAETGMPVDEGLAWMYALRRDDLARLPETRETLLKPDGSAYRQGDVLRQPKLAQTLRLISEHGSDYMYKGPWGEKLISALQAEGGMMTLEDLAAYEVVWADALVADVGNGFSIATSPWPNAGGVALIEAQQLADVAGLVRGPHYTESSEALRKALEITQVLTLGHLSPEDAQALFPGLDLSPEARVTKAHAEKLWAVIKDGSPLSRWKRTSPMHSDDVVAADAEGNVVAITHSINCALWGKTAINIDGISIGDPASYQQALVAATPPGGRLSAPTETGVVLRDGKAELGFASMGAGLHQRTFQGLLNYLHFGMTVEESINTPDFFAPAVDPTTFETTAVFPAGKFDQAVLEGTGITWKEAEDEHALLGGEGYWVSVECSPETGLINAASHNRHNSDAVAF